jgi:hypothetical protein
MNFFNLFQGTSARPAASAQGSENHALARVCALPVLLLPRIAGSLAPFPAWSR